MRILDPFHLATNFAQQLSLNSSPLDVLKRCVRNTKEKIQKEN
jgi:hypothetical protein